MYMQRERDDLLKRIRPGTNYSGDLSKAVVRAFECADAAASWRRELSLDASLTPDQRKERLASIVKDDLFPDLAGLVQPAKRAKAFVQAERQKLPPGVNLDKGVQALWNDAAAVDAALYFASREMAGIGI